jgi:hypothetical protein
MEQGTQSLGIYRRVTDHRREVRQANALRNVIRTVKIHDSFESEMIFELVYEQNIIIYNEETNQEEGYRHSVLSRSESKLT